MLQEFCSKCGTVLLFGLGQEEICWCPKCEGVILETKCESLKLLRKEISRFHTELRPLIKKYNKESLLISIYITREAILHSHFLDLKKFAAYSFLLKYVIESNFNGSQECDCSSGDFQLLIRYAEAINKSLISLRLVQNEWLRTIKVKNKDVKKYGFKVEESLAYDKLSNKFEGDQLESIVKFTATWIPIKENLKENDFYAEVEILKNNKRDITIALWDEFWASIRTKVSLELSTGNWRLLNVAHTQNILEYMHVLDKLVVEYPFRIKYEKDKSWTKCKLLPVDLLNFFHPFYKNDLELNNLKDFFITFSFKYTALGGILLTSRGLFVGPNTLKILSAFLKGKYSRDYLDGNRDVGKEFEDYVATRLEKNNFSITSPLDPSRKLMNIKDDPQHPKLEIDILAEFQGYLYVIECKNIVISTDFITAKRESIVKQRIDEEEEKQKRRIEYIKHNLESLGFDVNRIKGIYNVIVTYNKEPIEKYGDIKLVSVRELAKLKTQF